MSVGETTSGQTKDTAGRQRASGRRISGKLRGFGQGPRSKESFGAGCGTASYPVGANEIRVRVKKFRCKLWAYAAENKKNQTCLAANKSRITLGQVKGLQLATDSLL